MRTEHPRTQSSKLLSCQHYDKVHDDDDGDDDDADLGDDDDDDDNDNGADDDAGHDNDDAVVAFLVRASSTTQSTGHSDTAPQISNARLSEICVRQRLRKRGSNRANRDWVLSHAGHVKCM